MSCFPIQGILKLYIFSKIPIFEFNFSMPHHGGLFVSQSCSGLVTGMLSCPVENQLEGAFCRVQSWLKQILIWNWPSAGKATLCLWCFQFNGQIDQLVCNLFSLSLSVDSVWFFNWQSVCHTIMINQLAWHSQWLSSTCPPPYYFYVPPCFSVSKVNLLQSLERAFRVCEAIWGVG